MRTSSRRPPKRSAHAHAAYMLNSTVHWRPMVNGYSGLEPASFVNRVLALGGFPDPLSLAALRQAGVTHVFVHASEFPPATLEAIARTSALRRLAALDGIILYRFDQTTPASP